MDFNKFGDKLLEYSSSDDCEDKRIIKVTFNKFYSNKLDKALQEKYSFLIGKEYFPETPVGIHEYIFYNGIGFKVNVISENNHIPTVYISNRDTDLVSDKAEIIADMEDEDFPIVWVINKF